MYCVTRAKSARSGARYKPSPRINPVLVPRAPSEQRTRAGIPITFRLLTAGDLPEVMALERQVQSHPGRQARFEECLGDRQRCWRGKPEGQQVGYVVVIGCGV